MVTTILIIIWNPISSESAFQFLIIQGVFVITDVALLL